ncbi:MAG: ATP-binding protein [Clostridia bacterium]|nr:ATP-binding protein [Clostridia bacterium]
MIERITLRNFLSFKDETSIDFTASQEKPKSGFEYVDWYEEANKKKILKTIFLFGNNGTGKSNLITAVEVLRKLVCLNPKSKSDESTKLLNYSFKFSDETINKPSYVGMIFHTDGCRYQYEIEWHDNVILHECLRRGKGTGNLRIIFYRSYDTDKDITNVEFPYNDIKPESQKIIIENAIKNSSIVSIYDTMNIESKDLKNVYSYFRKIIIPPYLYDIDLLSMFDGRKENDDLKLVLIPLLKDLGSNIIDYRIDSFEVKISDDEAKFMKNFLGEELYNQRCPNGRREAKVLRFAHEADSKDGIAWLEEYEESMGTINMIKLIIAFHDAGIDHTPIFIDECSYGIHQLTFGRIIQFFLSYGLHSQAIMASQNLSIMEMEGFRRDTIRIFDKDRVSGKTFCKKIDLRKYHKNLNIVKTYLNNSFGSLPEYPTLEVWKEHLESYRKSAKNDTTDEMPNSAY